MKEHDEALAADISESLGRLLRDKLTRYNEALAKGGALERSATSVLRVALDYVKHNRVTDDPRRPDSPVNDVEERLAHLSDVPFPSTEDELED